MSLIHLLTDFGFEGPYVGEMKAVLCRGNENFALIDLMHDVPKFNIKSAAYLLSALSTQFLKQEACLAVVDPDVGAESRRAIIIVADEVTYCGPDNGLFSVVIQNAKSVDGYEIVWRPESLSTSFHGRDLFAPALGKFLNNEKGHVKKINIDGLVETNMAAEVDEIIYFDGFGNGITGRTAKSISPGSKIIINDINITFAETFSSVRKGEPFWYINSMGLVEVAINQGNIKQLFELTIGSTITVA